MKRGEWQLLTGLIALIGMSGAALAAPDPTRVMGPDECAECHDVATGIWEETHHFLTFETMPESDEGVAIAERLGIDDPIESPLCGTCHLTAMGDPGDAEVIAGVSCESCHGAALDWMDIHSEEDKPDDRLVEIWAEAEAAGMIRPANVYALASNCLSCHIVPEEELVNVGEHPAGSDFELVTYSQGEVRHNTYHSVENRLASPSKQRRMMVVGRAVEIEQTLRALAAVEQADSAYGQALSDRLQVALAALAEYAGAVDNSDLDALIAAATDPSDPAAAADTVAGHARSLAAPGLDLSALEPWVARLGDHKGEAIVD